MDPLTNLGLPSEEDIHAVLAEMFQAVDQSLEAVFTVNEGLVHDQILFLAVWSRLGAPFRRYWTAYLEIYRADQSRENGTSLELPGKYR
jgi:hypothetical protein